MHLRKDNRGLSRLLPTRWQTASTLPTHLHTHIHPKTRHTGEYRGALWSERPDIDMHPYLIVWICFKQICRIHRDVQSNLHFYFCKSAAIFFSFFDIFSFNPNEPKQVVQCLFLMKSSAVKQNGVSGISKKRVTIKHCLHLQPWYHACFFLPSTSRDWQSTTGQMCCYF